MSSAKRASAALAHIDEAIGLLSKHEFDTAWYLLSMAKLALLEVASGLDTRQFDQLATLMSTADQDFDLALSKKH